MIGEDPYKNSYIYRSSFVLRFIPSATTSDIVRLALFTERCAAGFPSPALFPYRSDCQSKLAYINSIYFSLLNPIWVCIQSLTKLTISEL